MMGIFCIGAGYRGDRLRKTGSRFATDSLSAIHPSLPVTSAKAQPWPLLRPCGDAEEVDWVENANDTWGLLCKS